MTKVECAKDIGSVFTEQLPKVSDPTLVSLMEQLRNKVVDLLGGQSRLPSRKKSIEPAFPKGKCLEIIAKLVKDPKSELFREPVDPQLKDYYAVIKKPMDLGTLAVSVLVMQINLLKMSYLRF